jgi:hypothetical protein
MRTVNVFGYIFAIFIILAAPASWGVVVELEDPPAIAIPSGYTDAATVKAIKFAMQQHNWTLVAEEQGEITAQLVVRGRHYVKVTVLYNERFIRIKYLDSRNMYYQMGVPEDNDVDEWGELAYKKVPLIHHRYNGWVNTFAKYIKRAL